jgi:hypothetical protein
MRLEKMQEHTALTELGKECCLNTSSYNQASGFANSSLWFLDQVKIVLQ